MVIGTGDIAKTIRNIDSPLTFIAAGFSNRNGNKPTYADFVRERKLIDRYSANHIVYFSSLSIYYADNDYTKYKKEIEVHIRQICEDYTILRIGNITWGDNPNTLINHLRKDQSMIKDQYRYIIDEDELLHWIGLIPYFGKHEMNITGKRMTIQEIVNEINNGRL